MVKISIIVNEEEHKKIKELAKKEGRSIASYMKYTALNLENLKKKEEINSQKEILDIIKYLIKKEKINPPNGI